MQSALVHGSTRMLAFRNHNALKWSCNACRGKPTGWLRTVSAHNGNFCLSCRRGIERRTWKSRNVRASLENCGPPQGFKSTRGEGKKEEKKKKGGKKEKEKFFAIWNKRFLLPLLILFLFSLVPNFAWLIRRLRIATNSFSISNSRRREV